MNKPVLLAAVVAAFCAPLAATAQSPAQRALFGTYNARAQGDAARGKAFFFADHRGGKPDTPSCVSCHSTNLAGPGATKAGKPIEPMAASVSPRRFTDAAEVEKWFRRNCGDVLGRECTPQEKSDVLAFLLSL